MFTAGAVHGLPARLDLATAVHGKARIVDFRHLAEAFNAGINRYSRFGPTAYRRPGFVGRRTRRSGQLGIQLKTCRTGSSTGRTHSRN